MLVVAGEHSLVAEKRPLLLLLQWKVGKSHRSQGRCAHNGPLTPTTCNRDVRKKKGIHLNFFLVCTLYLDSRLILRYLCFAAQDHLLHLRVLSAVSSASIGRPFIPALGSFYCCRARTEPEISQLQTPRYCQIPTTIESRLWSRLSSLAWSSSF